MQISHFVKVVMSEAKAGQSTVDRLIDEGLVADIVDLYNLKEVGSRA